MAQWLKDNVLDALGFGATPPSPGRPRHKRRATSDGTRRHKAARYDGPAHRSSPYITYPGQVRGTYYRPQSAPQAVPAPVRSASAHIVPTAGKVSAHSEDESVSGVDLPAGFETDEDIFDSIIPKINVIRTPEGHGNSTSPKAATVSPAVSRAQTKSAPKKNDAWLVDPNGKARDVIAMGLKSAASMQRDIEEPEYALRDIEIRDGILHIRDRLMRFSRDFFSLPFSVSEKALGPTFFAKFSGETAKVIGCVASGGPGGVEGWKEMFSNMGKRKALVCAIVGDVLTEQVFGHMFFGGIPEDVMDVVKLQEVHKHADGFDRNSHYATHIRAILDTQDTGKLDLPRNFSNHVSVIVATLCTHLAPILSLNPRFDTKSLIPGLHEIVTHAGILSLAMRIDPHTVYHFEPVFKEDTFSSKRTKCFNEKDMEQTNPRTDDDHDLLDWREKERRTGISSAEKKRAKNDDPLTQINIMDGVTAYRKGGWETTGSEIFNVKFEQTAFQDQGVRARMLVPGWVFCRWGRAREFKDGKSADVAKAHGVAWNGGFKEFVDVEGVVDWIGMERAEREKQKTAVLAKVGGKGKVPVGRQSAREAASSAKGKARIPEGDIQAQLREESTA